MTDKLYELLDLTRDLPEEDRLELLNLARAKAEARGPSSDQVTIDRTVTLPPRDAEDVIAELRALVIAVDEIDHKSVPSDVIRRIITLCEERVDVLDGLLRVGGRS